MIQATTSRPRQHHRTMRLVTVVVLSITILLFIIINQRGKHQ